MLQGSLDNFSLDEVLNLLAGTMKSGHLRISGDRGTGSLWIEEGRLVQAEASNTVDGGEWEDVMFELLRFESGNFSFVADDMAPSPGEPEEIDPLVERGRELLSEWNAIESVIPSPEHVLAPVAKLPIEQVMLTSAEWETIIAIGEGRSVSQTCSVLGVGELKGCRRIKSVVERGLVKIDEPGARAVDQASPEALAEAAVDAHPALEAAADSEQSNVVDLPVAEQAVPEVPEAPQGQQIVAAVPPTPPPAPPSPEEIRQFTESVGDVSSLGDTPPPPPPPEHAGGVNEDGSAAADDEASLLMKYLQSES
ncbi:MAG: DUF4388 domain-containing protein [Acidimicrobiales bacterium]|nr:DUF4388 domain-containing protein [Acidimicrobiales bacterium]